MNINEHLKDRHLDAGSYNGIMIFDDVVIFPLWNLSGKLCGYQQYRPGADKKQRNDPREGRYYTSIHGNKYEKPLGVWGLESLSYDPNILVITEGIFDACRLHNFGIPSVALLSSSFKQYRNWLTCLGRKIYKVEDDHASSLGPYQNLDIPPGRADLGESTDEEIQKMLIDNHLFTFTVS